MGVSAAVRRLGLAIEAPSEMFIPHLQTPWDRQMFVVVRATEDDAGVIVRVRESLVAADPDIAVGRILPLQRLVSNTVAEPRFRTMILGSFAVLALLLAGVGIYGVLAFSVSCRTRELGIRIALGADGRRVRGEILRYGARLVGMGLALGLVATLGATRTLEGLLYEVDRMDPLTLAGAVLAMSTVALIASYMPARRATKSDPLQALKAE